MGAGTGASLTPLASEGWLAFEVEIASAATGAAFSTAACYCPDLDADAVSVETLAVALVIALCLGLLFSRCAKHPRGPG